jgi:hypothetical protein
MNLAVTIHSIGGRHSEAQRPAGHKGGTFGHGGADRLLEIRRPQPRGALALGPEVGRETKQRSFAHGPVSESRCTRRVFHFPSVFWLDHWWWTAATRMNLRREVEEGRRVAVG